MFRLLRLTAPQPPVVSQASGFGTLDLHVQPAGSHHVEVSKDGYRRFAIDLAVRDAETVPLDVSLMPGDTMTLRMLRSTAIGIVTLLTLMLTGCATMKVSSHVERGAEFTRYRTWAWAPADAQPTGDPRLDNNPFFQDRLLGAVEHEMTRKGYVGSTLAGPPDLRVHYHANFSKTFEITGGARSGSCYGDCEPEAYAYEQGTLVVDVVDSRTEKVVWRGWVLDNMEGVIDRQDVMEREVDAAVAKMFELFPPTPD